MNMLQHIKDLEVQAEMMHQIGFELRKKATALRKELAERGAKANSLLSDKEKEFQAKADKVIARRKNHLIKKAAEATLMSEYKSNNL